MGLLVWAARQIYHVILQSGGSLEDLCAFVPSGKRVLLTGVLSLVKMEIELMYSYWQVPLSLSDGC